MGTNTRRNQKGTLGDADQRRAIGGATTPHWALSQRAQELQRSGALGSAKPSVAYTKPARHPLRRTQVYATRHIAKQSRITVHYTTMAWQGRLGKEGPLPLTRDPPAPIQKTHLDTHPAAGNIQGVRKTPTRAKGWAKHIVSAQRARSRVAACASLMRSLSAGARRWTPRAQRR